MLDLVPICGFLLTVILYFFCPNLHFFVGGISWFKTIANQLFHFDEQRSLINLGCGAYNNTTQRATLAAVPNTYYVNLWTYFQQGHIPVLSQKDDLQIRIYMDTLANNAVTGTAVLTTVPISTINSANLIAKVTRLQSLDVTNRLRSIQSRPE